MGEFHTYKEFDYSYAYNMGGSGKIRAHYGKYSNTTGSAQTKTIELGFEPQYMAMMNSASGLAIYCKDRDSTRFQSAGAGGAVSWTNFSSSNGSGTFGLKLDTGFTFKLNTSRTVWYIAIGVEPDVLTD